MFINFLDISEEQKSIFSWKLKAEYKKRCRWTVDLKQKRTLTLGTVEEKLKLTVDGKE